jgi:hypothetical protein
MKALEEQLSALAGEVTLLRRELKQLRENSSPRPPSGAVENIWLSPLSLINSTRREG